MFILVFYSLIVDWSIDRIKYEKGFSVLILQYLPFPGVNANLPTLSGMMSPANLFASPVGTPRGTPRGTPVTRWNGVAEDDYSNFMTSLHVMTNPEDGLPMNMSYALPDG